MAFAKPDVVERVTRVRTIQTSHQVYHIAMREILSTQRLHASIAISRLFLVYNINGNRIIYLHSHNNRSVIYL